MMRVSASGSRAMSKAVKIASDPQSGAECLKGCMSQGSDTSTTAFVSLSLLPTRLFVNSPSFDGEISKMASSYDVEIRSQVRRISSMVVCSLSCRMVLVGRWTFLSVYRPDSIASDVPSPSTCQFDQVYGRQTALGINLPPGRHCARKKRPIRW